MGRPSRDEILIENARSWAKRATCSRAQVGVVIARDGRILSTGYNGAPAGMTHCEHRCNCGVVASAGHGPGVHIAECFSQQPCTISVHAEANAIAFAARYGRALEDTELITTMCPCLSCAQLIINAGIVRVVAMNPYRDNGGLNLLSVAGLSVEIHKERSI